MATFMSMETGRQFESAPVVSAWGACPSVGSREALEQYLWALESSISIQQALLPEQLPTMTGIELSLRYLPKMGVSGDYYDFLPLYEGQIGLAIGDVCGKGIGAALLRASLCFVFRAQAQANSLTIEELLACLNRFVYHNTPEGKFVTLIYGIWDSSTHKFTYSSAGHPPALHYQATTRRVRELKAGGMVLGVCEGVEYSAESVPLEMGDALVLYTDGITEATDASDEVFGRDRLSKILAAYGEESSEALTKSILTAASSFAHQGWEDDVTLIVIKRIGD